MKLPRCEPRQFFYGADSLAGRQGVHEA